MNRLTHEKSPYLLQHADNPVDWYPWGDEAFATARREDKPIFLSIGYSTCHWCHVMAHESFEDVGIAALMNTAFVNIKVDREERPDIDSVYMRVCQGLTGGGGWPLTIIMTPDKRPFFAGTYFPKETRSGRIGMRDLMLRIDELWRNERDKVLESADQVTALFQQERIGSAMGEPGISTLRMAYEELKAHYDAMHGGFGAAPKFPTPHHLTFLLRYGKRFRDEQALEMVETTLGALRSGGIYDHVGFGFHRYSTDDHWFLPHFEKMLYDQALLAFVYTEAFQATNKHEYGNTAQEIFQYVLRELRSPEGGFFSAEDADSEGEEGKYYLWTEQEIRAILEEKAAELWIQAYGIEGNGNYHIEAGGKKTGANILFLKKTFPELAHDLAMEQHLLRELVERARRKLLAAREQRVRPRRDDKILADWNGLMIAALAKGAQVFDTPLYVQAASQAVDFILAHMRTPESALLHRYRDSQAAISGFLDDYAFLIWGLIELYETTFDIRFLTAALDLNTYLLNHFWDDKAGGFFFISDTHEELFVRTKELSDGALPSGNSVAALNLVRLGRMLGNPAFEEKATRIGQTFGLQLERMPSAFTQFLSALDFTLGASFEVVIAGSSPNADTKAMIQALRKPFIPNKTVLLIPAEDASEITLLAPFTKHMRGLSGKPTAYVCTGHTCQEPTTDIARMLSFLT